MSSLKESWRESLLPATVSIGEVIRNLNMFGLKIVMVTDEQGVLIGTISDGDVRRGLLKGLGLSSSIAGIMNRNALVVPVAVDRALVKQLMLTNKIHQIPVVDEGRRVVGLHLWDEVLAPTARSNQVVVMAGGKGTRLRPYTETCPKPLLPIAGKPILEHIVDRAKADGFSQFIFAVHYLGHMIEDYFGDGELHGVSINYLREHSPLGTAGALSLIHPKPSVPLIVTNGDVVTDIRYGELVDFHTRNNAEATMAVRMHEWQHPFGVVHMRGVEIEAFEEKPISRSRINAGVYVLEPSALNVLEPETACDMPNLFERLISQSKRTVAFPMHEPWLDVGRPDDLVAANKLSVERIQGIGVPSKR